MILTIAKDKFERKVDDISMNNRLTLEKALASSEFCESASPLTFVLGEGQDGNVVIADLEQLPHLIIAGATGTGKSTFAHGMVISIANKASFKNVRFVMCDTKMLEFSRYSGLPHLLVPPVTDIPRIHATLSWAAAELSHRLNQFARKGCRSISDYNNLAWESYSDELPHIVLFVDDAAVVAENSEAQANMLKIAQSGRSVGIHLVAITQSPSAKCIASMIKASIPARVVFNVLSKNDEKLLLDSPLKEPIAEIGTMMFYDAPAHRREIVQCFNVSDYAISSAVADAKERFTDTSSPENANLYDKVALKSIIQQASPYINDNLLPLDPDFSAAELDSDEMLPAAVDVILETGQASVSMLQRRMKLGYARAARIIDEMEEKGIVGPFQGSKPRMILVTKEQWTAMNEGKLPQDDLVGSECVPQNIEDLHIFETPQRSNGTDTEAEITSVDRTGSCENPERRESLEAQDLNEESYITEHPKEKRWYARLLDHIVGNK